MIKYYFPFFIILLISSCKTAKKEHATYFGGKIINPKSSFVLLKKNNKIIDSIFLNKDHTFLSKLDSIQEGLYTFVHEREYQYVYLEPNDSVLIRLNTWDFDKSLVFSGTNEEKNNLLIQSLLNNKKEVYFYYQISGLNPKDFKIKIDSIEQSKLKQIEDFKNEHPETSQGFLNLLKIALTYPVYSKIESYRLDHKRKTKSDSIITLSDSFYKYRPSISMSADSLFSFYPYTLYLRDRLYNDTYKQGFDKDTDEFTVALLKNTGKQITSENLKNNLLRNIIINHFYRKSSCETNKEAFFTFFKLNSSIADKKKIQRLYNDTKKVHKGKLIPNFNVTDYNNSDHKIRALIKNKKSVIYFRQSKNSPDYWAVSRLNYLMNKNPSLNFIIVNLVDDKHKYIKGLDIKNQYYLKSNSKANDFLTSDFSRTLYVNKNGVVVNGFASISSPKTQQQLADLQKD